MNKIKRGRPVGSKNKKFPENGKVIVCKDDQVWADFKLDQTGVDNDPGIDVPLHARGGAWKWNFEEQDTFDKGTVVGYESAASDFKRVNRITWVLTAVNVAILISLVIKNV